MKKILMALSALLLLISTAEAGEFITADRPLLSSSRAFSTTSFTGALMRTWHCLSTTKYPGAA